MRSYGFTLVEMLVVVSIMGVVFGGSIAGYNAFNQHQVLVNAGKELVSQLRQAQVDARSGIKPTGSCSRLDGYRVSSGSNSTQYTVTAVCNGNPAGASSTFTFPGGVRNQNAFTITFQGQFGGVIGVGNGAGGLDIRLRSDSGSRRYMININSAGGINDLGVQ